MPSRTAHIFTKLIYFNKAQLWEGPLILRPMSKTKLGVGLCYTYSECKIAFSPTCDTGSPAPTERRISLCIKPGLATKFLQSYALHASYKKNAFAAAKPLHQLWSMPMQNPCPVAPYLITEDHSKAAKDARDNRAAVNFLVKNMKGPFVICDQQLASAATFRNRAQGAKDTHA